MGRRDVSFDQDLPVPQAFRSDSGWTTQGLKGSEVVKLNDQHAFVQLSSTAEDPIGVGAWLEFGISHPCTVFDKWPLIPMLDEHGRVVELIRTFF
jgi:D-serine deaminase-like pyridoxal phosphate-dependent protein